MRNSIVAAHIFIKYKLAESGITAEMIQNKLDDISRMYMYSDMDMYIIEEAAEETAKTIIDSITDKQILKAAAPVDEYAEEIKRFKSRKNFIEISADNTAVNEIVYHFGTFAEAQRKARKLKINLVKSGYSVLSSSLDNLYCGFMEEFPALFKPCDNSSDQYIKLLSLADYDAPAINKMNQSPFYNDLITDLRNYILDNCEKWTAEEEKPTAENNKELTPTESEAQAIKKDIIKMCSACGAVARVKEIFNSYQHFIFYIDFVNYSDFNKIDKIVKNLSKIHTGAEYKSGAEKGVDFAVIVPKKDSSTKTFYKFEKTGGYHNLKHNHGDFLIGRNVETGEDISANIMDTKSLFIAGSSGGGKSSAMNSIISSLLLTTPPNFSTLIL